jgi:Cysteine-rich CPXCG
MLASEAIQCPYCGESIELLVDTSIDHQHYIEDCSVCCRPIELDVTADELAGIRIVCGTDSDA